MNLILKQIWIATEAKAPPISLATAELEAHRGIVGDRYHAAAGSFSRFENSGRPITLIAYEALIDIRDRLGIDLFTAGLHRRNLVISGASSHDLAELANRVFRIGNAVFAGKQPAHPCRFLERLAPPGTFDALHHCGGIRADILESGTINCGDTVKVRGPQRTLP